MNSRERVRIVLNGSVPDHVPCGLGGCETTGLHLLAYKKLQELLKTEKRPPRLDTFMCNAVFELDVLNAMGGDFLLLESPHMCKSPFWAEGSEKLWKPQELWGESFLVPVNDRFRQLENGTIIWETNNNTVCPNGAFYFDSPAQTDLFADFEYPSPDSFCPPMDLDDEFLRNLEKTAQKMYEETEFCICLGETITDLQFAPGGMIGSMVLMAEQPDVMMEYLEKLLASALSQLKQLDQAVGKYVDILLIAHDLGDNNGVIIGDEMWRKIYKPYYKRLFEGWHQITSMKINLHSCGSVVGIMEDLIECGTDIINPVQTSARGMSPEYLKKMYGDRIIFWGGGYDAQLFSPTDNYEHVYNVVAENIRIFKQNGGYIFSGVHNLPPNLPESHLAAMLDAWRDNR